MPNGPLSAPAFANMEVTQMKRADVSQPEDSHVTRTSQTRALLLDGDMLSVVNHDNHTVAFQWANKTYAIEKGETKFVLFEALVDALGDPRSMDNDIQKFNDGNGNSGIIMTRHQELTRMLARYGVKGEMVDQIADVAPKVVVNTLDGQRVDFPAFNPVMTSFPVANIDERAVNTDVSRMFESVQAEMSELRKSKDELEDRLNREIQRREGVEVPTE